MPRAPSPVRSDHRGLSIHRYSSLSPLSLDVLQNGPRDTKLDQAMNAAGQLLKQGVIPEAIKAEQAARIGIDKLRSGIEKAAESGIRRDESRMA